MHELRSTWSGKQCVNHQAQVEMRGSVVNCSGYPQRKMDGMVTWLFDHIMKSLPLVLQPALIGHVLPNYHFPIKKLPPPFSSFSTSPSLPPLPFPTVARSELRSPSPLWFDDERKKCFKRISKWSGSIFFQKKLQPRQKSGASGSGRFGTFGGSDLGDHIELLTAGPDQPSPLFNKETDWHVYVLDPSCIAWTFKMTMDSDVITAIMRFTPEIVWHVGINTTILERLYYTMLGCFDLSSGRLVVISKLRNKAYLSAKALLHLAIQHKCISDESNEAVLKSISSRYPSVTRAWRALSVL